MENLNRNVFSLSGVTGMLIATVLLLAILAGLTAWGIKAQQDVMQKPYVLEDAQSVPMIGGDAAKHMIIKDKQ